METEKSVSRRELSTAEASRLSGLSLNQITHLLRQGLRPVRSHVGRGDANQLLGQVSSPRWNKNSSSCPLRQRALQHTASSVVPPCVSCSDQVCVPTTDHTSQWLVLVFPARYGS